MSELRESLKITAERVDEINEFLLDPNNEMVNQLLEIVERYGGPQEINRKAAEARNLDHLMDQLKTQNSPYVADLEWLMEQRDAKAFISMAEYRNRVVDQEVTENDINEENAVTLEISALQYFPWLVSQAKHAIQKKELMPGRYIRVRNMAEQTTDQGDTLAVAAGMQIVGASYVETLDTKGIDGSNVHLGGPETITGYFGGIGQPNEYPLKWIDEYLKYYTTYGIKQVLNINAGSILAAYLLHRMGVDNEFKISVFMGIDNPYSIFWTLMTARMFSRSDGSTSLIGFNLSNSVNNATIREAAKIRKALGLEKVVRFEHHITETYKSIVRQPYNRREELVEIAKEVPNIAAKHEGGDPEREANLEHPSDILEYFLPKAEVIEKGLMDTLMQNYLEKHLALNLTADALTRAGIGVVCATNLHQ
ncbi:MAG: hypothetical protein DRH90_24370 [Deltaproteobacteria bacterium]|nr:MAG: hypothetical protein DRH90_24370 [Deltaproteobacteria bacterium]